MIIGKDVNSAIAAIKDFVTVIIGPQGPEDPWTFKVVHETDIDWYRITINLGWAIATLSLNKITDQIERAFNHGCSSLYVEDNSIMLQFFVQD